MDSPNFLVAGPETSSCSVVLAHGAGAPMDSPFMETVCQGLADRSIHTLRFEFPYMAKRRVDGKKRGPDQQKTLLECWRQVISGFDSKEVVIGGKSLGGRMASMVADETGVAGLVCLGYPFHPPSKPERIRVEHLKKLGCKTLIVQGTRDPFGGLDEVVGYTLSDNIVIEWAEDGEHNLIPRKRSGRTESQNLAFAVDCIASFVEHLKCP